MTPGAPTGIEAAGPSAPGRTTGSGRRRSSRQTLGVLLVGLLLSGLVCWWVKADARSRRQLELERVGQRLRRSALLSLSNPLEVLLSLPPFFEASDEVTRDEFRRFVESALQRHPGVRSFQWFPLVPGNERSAFEARVRATGVTGYLVKDVAPGRGLVGAGSRFQHLPLLYCEPSNEPVLGLDLMCDIERSRAPQAALEQPGLFATSRTFLVEDPRGRPVVFIYHRVRRLDASGVGQAIGVVNVGLRIHQLMTEALEAASPEGVEVFLHDEAAPSGEQALYASHRPLGVPSPGDGFRRDLQVADRIWSLEVRPLEGSALAGGARHWWALGAGIGLSLIAAFLTGAMGTIFRLRRRVEVATRLGQYTLGRKLGEGGMGQVFEARHAMLRRPTAVKLLHADRVDRTSLRRFEQEVLQTSRLTHPNTVSIFDYGCTADGVFYYAMEYLDGLDADTLVSRYGPLPDARVAHLLVQACGSLEEAHQAGLIHRDVKPANLFVCRQGGVDDVVKVLDFGLVLDARGKEVLDETSADSMTGTPAYMPPEASEDKSALDARSDLYSLGAVAWFLLTGRMVFEGDGAFAVMLRHQNDPPRRPSEVLGRTVDPDLESLVLHCLEKRPSDRPASASAIARRLRACACFGGWTSEDAAEWWRERRPAPPADDDAFPTSRGTLALDLRDR